MILEQLSKEQLIDLLKKELYTVCIRDTVITIVEFNKESPVDVKVKFNKGEHYKIIRDINDILLISDDNKVVNLQEILEWNALSSFPDIATATEVQEYKKHYGLSFYPEQLPNEPVQKLPIENKHVNDNLPF